jgi:NADPH:quinone reductase-like Zn-dependent oxidoreductase
VFSFPKSFTAILHFIKDLIEKGRFKAVIDRKYPLEQMADAYRYVSTGQKIGNVIITMDA